MELSVVIGFVGIIVTVITSVAALAYWLGRKFAGIDAKFRGVDRRFEGLERAVRGLALASSEGHKAIIDFLALKGLIEKKEAEYLSKRVESAFRLHAPNPLTEEELRFLKEFISKAARNVDEVTIEEAERAYELGLKMFTEDFDVKGLLAAMAATYVRGYLVSKEVKERDKVR